MENRPLCSIPVRVPALSSLSKQSIESIETIENDFYTAINDSWLKSASIPPFESDFGISEEVEACINKKSIGLLTKIWKDKETKDPKKVFLRTLAESCLHSASQHTSVEFLQNELNKLSCIQTKEDVFEKCVELASYRIPSILTLGYTIGTDKKVYLCVNGNISSLPSSWYYRKEKRDIYKDLLEKLGKDFKVQHLETVYQTEKDLVDLLDRCYRDIPTKTTGNGLRRKFPSIDWETFFTGHGIHDWKTQTIYYRSPQWIRKVGKLLKEIPIQIWKLLLAKAILFASIQYLPPPYDEYENTLYAFGQTIKKPQMELFLSIVYDYCSDLFSPILWEEYGDSTLVDEIGEFVESIVNGGKRRIETVEWMSKKTKETAIEKLTTLQKEYVIPRKWSNYKLFDLDSKCLLQNILLLGAHTTYQMVQRIGNPYVFWEEGIYRVNAYYFNENNEIMIPFGTIVTPFYIRNKKKIGWNYGALGSIIGHEISHAFDEDGKEYDANGIRRNWWDRKDKREYHKKANELIKVYNKEKVGDKHVNGKKTLSENIADLAGVGIALHALKEKLKHLHLSKQEEKREYQDFFIGYAVSWRTKSREKKLDLSLEMDNHAPAKSRVNVVVKQFEEWYEAFDLDKKDSYLRIF